MDRAGGKGQPPPQSGLPTTLHGSLITSPDTPWEDEVPPSEGQRTNIAATPVEERPQNASYPYAPSLFEEGSSRGSRTSLGYYDEDLDYPPPPKRRRAGGITSPLAHAYQAAPSTSAATQSSQLVYPPSFSTQRLPGVRSLEAGPSGSSPVRLSPPPLRLRRSSLHGEENVYQGHQFRPELDYTPTAAQAQFPTVEYRTPTQEQFHQAFNPVAAPDPTRLWVPFGESAAYLPRERSRSAEAHHAFRTSRSSISDYSQSDRGEFGYPSLPTYDDTSRRPAAHQISTYSTLTPNISRASIPAYNRGYAPRPEPSISAPAIPARTYEAAGSRPIESPEVHSAGTIEEPRPRYLSDQWSESQARSGSERPASSQPTERSDTAFSKKHASVDSDEDDEPVAPRKVPRKTAIACNFCRRRKLKCDGLTPSCKNCLKRREPCTYVPYAKRRGPGKAPKGQRKTKQEGERRHAEGEAHGGESEIGQAQGSVEGVLLPHSETSAAPGPGLAQQSQPVQLAAPTPVLAAGSYGVYPLASSPDPRPRPVYGGERGTPTRLQTPRVDPGSSRAFEQSRMSPISIPSLRLAESPPRYTQGGAAAPWPTLSLPPITEWQDAERGRDVWGRRGSRDSSSGDGRRT